MKLILLFAAYFSILFAAYFLIGFMVFAILYAMDIIDSDSLFLSIIGWPFLIAALILLSYFWVLMSAGHWLGEWINNKFRKGN